MSRVNDLLLSQGFAQISSYYLLLKTIDLPPRFILISIDHKPLIVTPFSYYILGLGSSNDSLLHQDSASVTLV